MHIIMATVLICIIISTLYIVFLKSQFGDNLAIHQERSIQLYLDRQLIIKMISNLVEKAGIHNIIHDTIEYFTLEDIIILNPKFESNNSTNNYIAHYIQDNMQEIAAHLADNKFFKTQQIDLHKIDAKNPAKQLLIQYLDNKQKNWIVYVENIKQKLSKNDIEVLTNAITPILKIAYTNRSL